jgi:hypothetical protein
MARRFGYWIIGTALGLGPLSGCALFPGRNSSSSAHDKGSVAFWDRQFQGASLPEAATKNSRAAPDSVVHESDRVTPGPTDPLPMPEGPNKAAETPVSPGPVSVFLPILPTVGTNEPKQTAVPPAAPAPQIEIRTETPPAEPQVSPSRREPGTREPLVEALQCVLDNRHNEALQLLRKYDQPTQEVFLCLLPILGRMTQKSIDQMSPSEVAVLGELLHSLSVTLRPHSQLVIDKASFCEWITSFGLYKPVPEGHAFLGSTPHRPGELVQLYVELRNFASEFKNGSYATRLSSSVEIRDQKGDQVWLFRFDDGKQPIRSRTLLHDYFNNYCFYVPNNLPAGTYQLIIQVSDETRAGEPRTASKTLEFRVTSVSARVP